MYEIFADLGLNAEFHMYPGNHRTVFNNKEQIFNDLDIFLAFRIENNDKIIQFKIHFTQYNIPINLI